MFKSRLFVCLALVCLFLGSGVAVAQTFGTIGGEVRDPSGAVIGGTAITLTNVATNAARSTESNAAGIYSFPAVPPGVYTIRAEKAGFRSYSRTDLRMEVELRARVDIEMQVGQITETVEVSAQAALLSSENATIGTVIQGKQIADMPLNGRNYLSLVALAPNVSYGFPSAGQAGSRQGGIRADQSISVAGQRSQYNRYTLDGVENTDPNFNTFVVLPSIDALQEFKVQSGIYSAEFGRGATQINVSTKSGSNQYHGTLFSFVRNEKLDAKNYAFTSSRPPKDPFKWNQFGFTVGGPVSIPKLFNGKDRLFFMSNYEWFRQRRNVQSVSSVASAAMQGGDFSELTRLPSSNALSSAGIFDPRTRTPSGTSFTASPFLNNVIPATRIDATSKQLLEFYRLPNLGNTDLRNNFVQSQGRPINRDQFIQRLDFVESSKSQWSARYSWGDENQLTESLNLNGSKVVTNFNQYMVSNTRVLSATMVNEARFGFTQFYNTNGPELAFSRDVVGTLKIPGLASGIPVQWGIPSISISGYTGFGNDSEGPYENNNSAKQVVDNFSIIRGKHSFKFGGEIRNDHYNQVGNQFARGQFTFQRNATNNLALTQRSGDPFADFLLGETYQAEASVSIANAKFRSTAFALYFDDVWKLTSKVTLNVGLRYELTPPWEDQTGTLFNGIVRFDARMNLASPNVADRSLYPFFMRQGAARQNCYEGINIRWTDIEVRCDGSLGNRLVGTDKNDFAPRFGITWSPTPKWVIRTGGGYFYSQDSGNPRFDMARNLAGRLRFNSRTDVPNLNWSNALSSIVGSVANVATPYTFANPYDRRTPYAIQYLFNVQRELPMGTVLEVGYLGSVSRHLESLRAVNEALPADPRVDSRTIPQRSPFPNFGRIQLVENGNTGSYNALGVKLTKRYSSGLTYLVSYTYAKSLDTATAIRNQGGDTLFPQNSYCRGCEKARSSHDVKHRLVPSVLWELPFGKGRKFGIDNSVANAVAGGWQLSSGLTLQTGFPVTVTNSLDTSGAGGLFDRPDSLGRNADLSRGQQDPQRFFDTTAFVVNRPGQFGNVGRNTLNSPGIINWDFSAMKNFNIFSEGRYLQFRFESFNFTNHPNWNNPTTNISSSSFGQITSTRLNMRNTQLALKLVF